MSAARSDTAWTVPSGDYGVGANWSSGLPGPGNNAEIANGGTAFSFNLTLDGYALAVANAGSELATDFDLNVGNLGTGGLVIEEGGMVSTGWGPPSAIGTVPWVRPVCGERARAGRLRMRCMSGGSGQGGSSSKREARFPQGKAIWVMERARRGR